MTLGPVRWIDHICVDEGEFADRNQCEVIVYEIEPDNAYPEGIRYSFQYVDANGSTLLRYDNYTGEHGARHHRHHDEDGITPIEFDRWENHVRAFVREMREIHDERT